MSATAAASSTSYLTNLGLGYAISITLGFLVLLVSVLLVSYICCHTSRRHSPASNPDRTTSSDGGVILPRIIFVTEEEDGELENDTVVGLEQSVINSYPKFQFAKEALGPTNTICSICLCEYKKAEMLRMMPECRHLFHLLCLDTWLKLSGSCPVCRNSPLPTPLSTPLAEVVPLSQYGDDRRGSR